MGRIHRPLGSGAARKQSGGRIDQSRKRASGYIAGPIQDTVFLIAAPLVAILAFLPFGLAPAFQHPLVGHRFGESLAEGFINTVIFGHLFIVFFRSHLNPQIFGGDRLRFVVVPILLFSAMAFSTSVLVTFSVLAVWWDVYHSSLQTFGIGRIYDMRAGNDPRVGRRLDMIWNLVMYVGPILAGASLIGHLDMFRNSTAELSFLSATLEGNARWVSLAVLAFSVPFSFYYVYCYWRLAQQGYRVSPQKVALYIVLGVVSIACWGFNSFGEAFFVMNFFHALQYFFLVWHLEGNNITRRFGLGGVGAGPYLALAVFLVIATSFGIWSTGFWATAQPPQQIFQASLILVSILHFWYDGFIWSVQRKQV